MKKIEVKSIRLTNFKCHKSLCLDFDCKNVSVYGDNATGKSSVYDALTWLLFGKDSRGNGEKNIEVKPLDASGRVVDHDALTEVEAVLTVDGTDISLRRTYKEIWTTKRGSVEQSYDGNTSEYFVDGVPVKKYAFQDKIEELVSEETFLMLTSITYFADTLAWQERRKILFDISKVADDRQIMTTKAEFCPLLQEMGNLSLDDYKLKLTTKKREYAASRSEVPARISECERTIEDLAGLDYEKAEKELVVLQAKLDQLSGELLAIERSTAVDQKRTELREAQLELERLEMENNAHRDAQKNALADVSSIKNGIKRIEDNIRFEKGRIGIFNAEISQCEKSVEECRERWKSTNSEKFTPASCPACGQALPPERVKELSADFESKKTEKLRLYESEADRYKKNREVAEKSIENIEITLKGLEKELEKLKDELAICEGVKVEIVDLEDYTVRKETINKWLDDVQNDLIELSRDNYAAAEGVREKIKEVKEKMAGQNVIVAKRSTLEYAKKRIESLREDARRGSEEIAKIENMLFLIDEFCRYKTEFVEDGVNSLFKIARFRLYREQANGGVEDRCDVVYDGVPYISLNSGAKINVGIDIINTLSKVYGVSVPLFIDNAESVTKLEKSTAQIIRLVVSEKDKELRLDYEN